MSSAGSRVSRQFARADLLGALVRNLKASARLSAEKGAALLQPHLESPAAKPAAQAAWRCLPMTLAVDAMSGDHGFPVVIEAVRLALEDAPQLKILLVGDKKKIQRTVRKRIPRSARKRVHLIHAPEVVLMDEAPSHALRHKRESSMRRAIDLVKDGRAQAVVSAGNTGALMAIARFVLKTLPGIDRPAIMSPLPTVRGTTHVLDLGANAECTAQQLYEFAVMGAAAASAATGKALPTVALLNIGAEEIKGGEVIHAAAERLSHSPLNYMGYIEGDQIFLEPVDVVVCDGFVGNVALKAGEGVAKLLTQFMREEFTRNNLTRLLALFAKPVLNAIGRRMDPRGYNGASLLGLRGIVIKSHGSADALAFANAIQVAMREVEQDLPRRIHHLLESMNTPRATAAVVTN